MPIISGSSGGGGTNIIGVTQYGPASLATYSFTSTTLTAIDTTNVTVSFTVPASGNVLVTFQASMDTPATADIGLGLLNHSGGAQLGFTQSNVQGSVGAGAASIQRFTVTWYLTGLGAGTLGIDVAAGSTAATAHIYAQGSAGAVSAAKTGPAILVVQAA
jgi:hypothetical protein